VVAAALPVAAPPAPVPVVVAAPALPVAAPLEPVLEVVAAPPLPVAGVFVLEPVDAPVLGDVVGPLAVLAEFPVLVAPLLPLAWPLLLPAALLPLAWPLLLPAPLLPLAWPLLLLPAALLLLLAALLLLAWPLLLPAPLLPAWPAAVPVVGAVVVSVGLAVAAGTLVGPAPAPLLLRPDPVGASVVVDDADGPVEVVSLGVVAVVPGVVTGAVAVGAVLAAGRTLDAGVVVEGPVVPCDCCPGWKNELPPASPARLPRPGLFWRPKPRPGFC
jgi:hypothetical protein